MLESILKSIVSFMLVVLYCQRILLPSISVLQEKKQEYFKLKASVENFTDGQMKQENENIQLQVKKIDKGFEMVKSFVPPFDSAMANIEDKFDDVKRHTTGNLKLTKSPTFRYEEDLVKWHFKLTFSGAFKEAINMIAMLEGKGQLVKIDRLKINPESGDSVKVEADLDLIFLNMSEGSNL